MITTVCSNCGKTIAFMNDNPETGFCEYCGTKLQFQKNNTYQHTGSVIPVGVPTVRSLCEKGFHEINSKDYFRAEKTFDRAAELDCNDIEVLLGKSLIKRKGVEGINGFITFDSYYFRLLQKKAPSISAEEKNRINVYNCKLFLKLYCYMWDAARVEYVINRFPNSVDLELLFTEHFSATPLFTEIVSVVDEDYKACIEKMLDINNPVNVVRLLLSKGIEASRIFGLLYYQAHKLADVFGGERDVFHSKMLPLYVLQQLEEKERVCASRISVSIPEKNMDTGRWYGRKEDIPFYRITQYAKIHGGENYDSVFNSYRRTRK